MQILPAKRKEFSFTECSQPQKRRMSIRDIDEDEDMSSPIPSPNILVEEMNNMEVELHTEQEFIVFCIDLDEEISSVFKQTCPRLDHLKKALSLFVRSKLKADPTTKFALSTLRVSSIWLMDFTSNFNEVKSKFDKLQPGGRFNAFDMTTLFDMLEDKYNEVSFNFKQQESKRNWSFRTIFVYSRSSTIPCYLGGESSLENLKKIKNFYFEPVYMYHNYQVDHQKIVESIEKANKSISKVSDLSSIRKFYYCILGLLYVPPSQRPPSPKYQRFPVGLINENVHKLGTWLNQKYSLPLKFPMNSIFNQIQNLNTTLRTQQQQIPLQPPVLPLHLQQFLAPGLQQPQIILQQPPQQPLPIVPPPPQQQHQNQQNINNEQPLPPPPPQQQAQLDIPLDNEIDQPLIVEQQPPPHPNAPLNIVVENNNINPVVNNDNVQNANNNNNNQNELNNNNANIDVNVQNANNNNNNQNVQNNNNVNPEVQQPQQVPVQPAVVPPPPQQPQQPQQQQQQQLQQPNIANLVYYPPLVQILPNFIFHNNNGMLVDSTAGANAQQLQYQYLNLGTIHQLAQLQQQVGIFLNNNQPIPPALQQQYLHLLQQIQQQQYLQSHLDLMNQLNQNNINQTNNTANNNTINNNNNNNNNNGQNRPRSNNTLGNSSNSNPPPPNTSATSGESPLTPYISSIGIDMKQYLNNDQFSDVAFLVAKNDGDRPEKIYAHRVILCARSRYFRALFTNGMRESVKGREIPVSGVSPDVFSALLCYLYTDDIPQNNNSNSNNNNNNSNTITASSDGPSAWLTELLILANQYMLDGLKIKCCELIGETLTHSNLVGLMSLANLHEATELKKACISFFYNNLPFFLRDCSFEPSESSDGTESLGFLIVDYFSKVAKLSVSPKSSSSSSTTTTTTTTTSSTTNNNNVGGATTPTNNNDESSIDPSVAIKDFDELVSLFWGPLAY